MRNLAIAIFFMLASIAGASAFTITVNSVSNTIMLPANANIGYNAIAAITVNFNTGNGMVSNSFQLTTPPIAQAQTYNAINNGNTVVLNNVTINSPPNVSVSKGFSPSTSLQSFSSNPIPGVFFSASVNAIQSIPANVQLSFNGIYQSNSTCQTHICNIIVSAPAYPTLPICMLNKTITPSLGLVSQFSNLTSPCRVILTINNTRRVNRNQVLLAGQNATNATLNYSFIVPPINALVGFPALQTYYQQTYASSCNHLYTPLGAKYGVCLDNLSALSIGDILNSKNLSEGVGAALLHIQNAQTQQQAALSSSYNALNQTYQAVYRQNQTSANVIAKLESGNEAQGWQIGGVFAIFGTGAFAWAYLRNRVTQSRRVWNLK